MTVALSRARLGLYILGRREVFEAVYELRPAFEQLFAKPDKLMLVTGEMWPSKRVLAEEGDGAVEGEVAMEGVEHLGQYVFEMTKTRMGEGAMAVEEPMAVEEVEGGEDEGEGAEDVEDGPGEDGPGEEGAE